MHPYLLSLRLLTGHLSRAYLLTYSIKPTVSGKVRMQEIKVLIKDGESLKKKLMEKMAKKDLCDDSKEASRLLAEFTDTMDPKFKTQIKWAKMFTK